VVIVTEDEAVVVDAFASVAVSVSVVAVAASVVV
jgi:hypothetical protein